mgnify:CR=1 FL=1
MNKTFTNAKSTFSYYFTLENIKIIQTTCQQTSDMWTELVCNIFVCDVILNEHDCDDLILRTKWNNRNQLSYKIFICDVILNVHDWMILFFELNGITGISSPTKYLFVMLFWMNMIVMILFLKLNGINEINSHIKYLFVMLFWMNMTVVILFFELNGINEINSFTKYLFVMLFWMNMTGWFCSSN